MRHPLYVGWLFAFWMTPVMTFAHLLFSIATTAYILLAIQFEERDLVREHGDTYEEYRRSVPMLVPLFASAARKRRRINAPERLTLRASFGSASTSLRHWANSASMDQSPGPVNNRNAQHESCANSERSRATRLPEPDLRGHWWQWQRRRSQISSGSSSRPLPPPSRQ